MKVVYLVEVDMPEGVDNPDFYLREIRMALRNSKTIGESAPVGWKITGYFVSVS